MFKITSKLLLIFLLLCFGYSAYNQNNWEQVILSDSIDIKSLYFYEEDIYLATRDGIYYSNDNFQSIDCIGLEEHSIAKIIYTSNNELTAFTSGGEICKYLGNNNWNIYQGFILKATCVFESSFESLFYGAWGNIFKSQDFGVTWDTVWSGYNTEVINDMEETSDGLLFAGSTSWGGSYPGGIYRSDNQGETWNQVGLGFLIVNSIEKNSENKLFAGVYGFNGGVYKAIDTFGTSWVNIYNTNALVNDMKINFYNTIFIGCAMEGYPGGVYCSYDDGETWEDITGDLPFRTINRVNISYNSHVYVYNNTSNLLYRTINPITYNNENLDVNTFIVYPSPIKNSLRFSLSVGGQFDISINDLNGREVFQCNKVIEPNQTETVNISNISPGIYFVTISNYEFTYSTKFIKN